MGRTAAATTTSGFLCVLILTTTTTTFAVATLACAAALSVLASFDFLDGVAHFGEALLDFLGRSLVGVVLDGDGLLLDVGLNGLHAANETHAVLDFVLAILTVHLRGGGEDNCLDVLGGRCEGEEGKEEGEKVF